MESSPPVAPHCVPSPHRSHHKRGRHGLQPIRSIHSSRCVRTQQAGSFPVARGRCRCRRRASAAALRRRARSPVWRTACPASWIPTAVKVSAPIRITSASFPATSLGKPVPLVTSAACRSFARMVPAGFHALLWGIRVPICPVATALAMPAISVKTRSPVSKSMSRAARPRSRAVKDSPALAGVAAAACLCVCLRATYARKGSPAVATTPALKAVVDALSSHAFRRSNHVMTLFPAAKTSLASTTAAADVPNAFRKVSHARRPVVVPDSSATSS